MQSSKLFLSGAGRTADGASFGYIKVVGRIQRIILTTQRVDLYSHCATAIAQWLYVTMSEQMALMKNLRDYIECGFGQSLRGAALPRPESSAHGGRVDKQHGSWLSCRFSQNPDRYCNIG